MSQGFWQRASCSWPWMIGGCGWKTPSLLREVWWAFLSGFLCRSAWRRRTRACAPTLRPRGPRPRENWGDLSRIQTPPAKYSCQNQRSLFQVKTTTLDNTSKSPLTCDDPIHRGGFVMGFFWDPNSQIPDIWDFFSPKKSRGNSKKFQIPGIGIFFRAKSRNPKKSRKLITKIKRTSDRVNGGFSTNR